LLFFGLPLLSIFTGDVKLYVAVSFVGDLVDFRLGDVEGAGRGATTVCVGVVLAGSDVGRGVV